MKNFLTSLRTLILALVLSIGISYAYAAWSPPSTTPTGGNTDAPVNVGSATQVKAGALTVNGLLTAVSNVVVGGTVEVGDITPTNTACTAGIAGSIKYDGTDLMGCVGGTWKSLTAAGGGGGSQTWSTSGPYSFTVPSGVSVIDITTVGGGGGGGCGGGSDKNTNGGGGGGGAAGTIGTRLGYAVTQGEVFNLTVGSGGINPGGCGGNQFTGNGSAGNPGASSSVVKASTGTLVISGNPGSGGSGGIYSAGTATGGAEGSPGASCPPYGTGGPGAGGINSPGSPASGNCAGGGGGGGGNTSSNTQGAAGGAGGDGLVTISWN